MKDAKNFEVLLYNWIIEHFSLGKQKHRFEEVHSNGKEIESMKKYLIDFFKSKIISDVILKPKVEETPSYGNKVESKTDLIIVAGKENYRFSVKKDTNKSYIHSSGCPNFNKRAFLGAGKNELISHDLYETLLLLFEEVCLDLQNFESVPRGRTIEYHVDHVLETRGFTREQVLADEKTKDKFLPVRQQMILLYENGISSQEKIYKPTLKSLEDRVKKTLWIIFNEESNQNYAKRLVYDLITGTDRFGKDSLSTAEYIINSEGIFHIDSPDCYYVGKLINCFKSRKENSKGLLGRLQNVPRQGISKATWLLEDYLEIAKTSATADLSIKI